MYCATCSAALWTRNDTLFVGVVSSAIEEAIFLAKCASKVTVVHRRSEFRASKIMLERARAIENIEWLTPYVPEAFLAREAASRTQVRLRHAQTRETGAGDTPGA